MSCVRPAWEAYETGTGSAWRPEIQKIAETAKSFPALSFNLAIEWPCISAPSDPPDEQFQAALQAEIPPHDRVMENLSASFEYLKKEI